MLELDTCVGCGELPVGVGVVGVSTLALKVNNAEVLRILLSIGPTETMHFQTWHDKAGSAVSAPLAPLTDSTTKNPTLVFPNLNLPPFGGEDFQTNLIMPEACPFLSPKLPVVSVIRPVSTSTDVFGAKRAFGASPPAECSPGSPWSSSRSCNTWRKARTKPGGGKMRSR